MQYHQPHDSTFSSALEQLSTTSKVKALFLFFSVDLQINISARGKRHVSRKVSSAKMTKVNSESQSNVADEDFEFQSTDIWMLGDSILNWAGAYATERGTPNLKLRNPNSVGWYGIRGMSWTHFTHSLQLWILFQAPPSNHYTI